MNARKPAEKRKRTLRQWGFLSIHVVLLFALWAAIVAVNINITSIEQFAGSVGGGGAGIVGQLVNAIPAALPALFGGILQTLAKKLSRLSKWDNPESQRIHELYLGRVSDPGRFTRTAPHCSPPAPLPPLQVRLLLRPHRDDRALALHLLPGIVPLPIRPPPRPARLSPLTSSYITRTSRGRPSFPTPPS